MENKTLSEIIETAKGLMIHNDRLIKLANDQSLPMTDRAELLSAATYSIDNVQNILTFFNEKYLQ